MIKLEMKEMQDFFDSRGGTKMILNVLSDSNTALIKDELLEAFLDFGIKLLENGNSQVQRTIYLFCKNQPKSEMLFKKFDLILQNEIDRVNSRDQQLN